MSPLLSRAKPLQLLGWLACLALSGAPATAGGTPVAEPSPAVADGWQADQVRTTSPIWESAPARTGEPSWQAVDSGTGLASSWQKGPTDGARPASTPRFQVRGVGRGITVNGHPYPDVSLKLPNGFAADQRFFLSTQLSGTSRTRFCRVAPGQSGNACADGELLLEVTPLKSANASLGFNWMIQSLSGRYTGAGSAQSLGFKGAINLTPSLGLAFGGEQIIQFDSQTDLGRNFYLLLSQATPLSSAEKPAVLVATAGIGSDFFGYGGNGVLGRTNCIGGNNISSRRYPTGTDCYWGPVAAISLALNDRIAFGAEWFGYGIGAGISLRPFERLPLTASFYATDFLGNTPSYIQGTCTTNPCRTRYYGRLTYSF